MFAELQYRYRYIICMYDSLGSVSDTGECLVRVWRLLITSSRVHAVLTCNKPQAKVLLGQRVTGVTPAVLHHSIFGVTWRRRSHDHLIAHMPFPIGGPLEQSLYSNGFRDIQRRMSRNGWHDIDTTSKGRSKSLISIPIDFSYRLSIATSICNFCRTHRLATTHSVETDRRQTDGRNTVPIARPRPLVLSAKNSCVYQYTKKLCTHVRTSTWSLSEFASASLGVENPKPVAAVVISTVVNVAECWQSAPSRSCYM